MSTSVPTSPTISTHLAILRSRDLVVEGGALPEPLPEPDVAADVVPGPFGVAVDLRFTAGPGALRLALTGVSRRCVGGKSCSETVGAHRPRPVAARAVGDEGTCPDQERSKPREPPGHHPEL